MTFRHVLQMGYGQPKHTMESGDKQRDSLVFVGMLPWDERMDNMKSQTDAMLAAKEQEERLALEAAKKPETIDDKNDSEAPVETLELVVEPPPQDFSGGRR